VQVGTSRDSSVSRGADYPFTLTQTREYSFSAVSPSSARIHRPRELDDLYQAASIPMSARRHEATNIRKPLKIESLARQKREPLEVRNHLLEKILEPAGLPLERPIAPVRPDASASEVRL
jgi:hypothetical protein